MKYILIPLLAALLFCSSGCASFSKYSGKSLTSIASTVDNAMQGWAAYAVTHNITPEEHGKVRGAYEKYQVSMNAAKIAYIDAIRLNDQSVYEIAFNVLVDDKDGLFAVLKTFGVKV